MLVVLDGVVALSSENKVGGNELRALVEQLVERVLGVRGRFTKQDWSRGVFDVFSATGDGLAVGLHGQLLKVGGKPVEVLVESGHGQKCSLGLRATLTERQGESGHRRSLSTIHSTVHQ